MNAWESFAVQRLTQAGFEPTSVVAAVLAGNIRLLKRGVA